MKKFFLLSLFVSAFLVATQAQTYLNGSFENWSTYTSTAGNGEYPTGWQTSDSLTLNNSLGRSAVRETSERCDSNAAIKLTSIGFLTLTGPGLATNGVISGSLTSYSIIGGSPDTSRSRWLSGCYRYTPVGADSGIITAVLYKWNTASSMRDTIAIATNKFGGNGMLTTFQYPFVYRDFDRQPDSVLILLQSSPALFTASIGSTLIVDNIQLSGFVNIAQETNPVQALVLYPNPVTTLLQVNIKLSAVSSVQYLIMDSNGKKIKSGGYHDDLTINTSRMAAGVYSFVVIGYQNQVLATQKFTVVKQ